MAKLVANREPPSSLSQPSSEEDPVFTVNALEPAVLDKLVIYDFQDPKALRNPLDVDGRHRGNLEDVEDAGREPVHARHDPWPP